MKSIRKLTILFELSFPNVQCGVDKLCPISRNKNTLIHFWNVLLIDILEIANLYSTVRIDFFCVETNNILKFAKNPLFDKSFTVVEMSQFAMVTFSTITSYHL